MGVYAGAGCVEKGNSLPDKEIRRWFFKIFVRMWSEKGLTYKGMNRKIIPYNPKLIPLARQMRNNSTLSEVLLWQKIRNKQLLGYDFDRQKPIGNYIVDFFCRELMLAIEIDGSSHEFKSKEDLARQQQIEQFGITVIRFEDIRVKQDMDRVLGELKWQVHALEE
jgi:very-short-patch-repair endonuclease